MRVKFASNKWKPVQVSASYFKPFKGGSRDSLFAMIAYAELVDRY